jgi:hypothetical protein
LSRHPGSGVGVGVGGPAHELVKKPRKNSDKNIAIKVVVLIIQPPLYSLLYIR